MELMVSQSNAVERFTFSSFLNETSQKHYWQSYQGRLKQLLKKIGKMNYRYDASDTKHLEGRL
jgi:hypothetical protein